METNKNTLKEKPVETFVNENNEIEVTQPSTTDSTTKLDNSFTENGISDMLKNDMKNDDLNENINNNSVDIFTMQNIKINDYTNDKPSPKLTPKNDVSNSYKPKPT